MLCESGGLSLKNAKQIYGIAELQTKKRKVLEVALNTYGSFRTFIMQDKALLQNIGIHISDSDSGDSDGAIDSKSDLEQSDTETHVSSTENDENANVKSKEVTMDRFEVSDEEEFINRSTQCDPS